MFSLFLQSIGMYRIICACKEAIFNNFPYGSVADGLTQTRRRSPGQTTVSQTRPLFWEPLLPPSRPHSRPEKFSTDTQNLITQASLNTRTCEIVGLYLPCRCRCGCRTVQSSGSDVWLRGRVLPLGDSCFSYSLN